MAFNYCGPSTGWRAARSCFARFRSYAAVADEFERLRHNKKLQKIGRADLLIAAIALAHEATVVTRNLRHFRQVPGLQVDNWFE